MLAERKVWKWQGLSALPVIGRLFRGEVIYVEPSSVEFTEGESLHPVTLDLMIHSKDTGKAIRAKDCAIERLEAPTCNDPRWYLKIRFKPHILGDHTIMVKTPRGQTYHYEVTICAEHLGWVWQEREARQRLSTL